MNRSSLMPPSSGSYSYLLRPPLGISTTQVSRKSFTVSAGEPGPSEVSVHLSPGDRQTRLAPGPWRIPRVTGHVLAAQRGVRILLGHQVAQLLEPVVVDPGSVPALRMDIRGNRRPSGDRCCDRGHESEHNRDPRQSKPNVRPQNSTSGRGARSKLRSRSP